MIQTSQRTGQARVLRQKGILKKTGTGRSHRHTVAKATTENCRRSNRKQAGRGPASYTQGRTEVRPRTPKDDEGVCVEKAKRPYQVAERDTEQTQKETSLEKGTNKDKYSK